MKKITTRGSVSEPAPVEVLSAEDKALAELKDLLRKHSVTWPQSELVTTKGSAEDGNQDSNLMYVTRNWVMLFAT